jgi:16S rRNA (guanine527-N7)-methyltransferase
MSEETSASGRRISAGLGALGLTLPPDRAQLLVRYCEMLRTRGVAAGFVAEGDRDRLEERHVLDSLRAATHVRGSDLAAYDLGSGAGLPGVPVAIAHLGLRVELIEARRSRVAFLEWIVDELGLGNAFVRWSRTERMPPGVDLCFARAFAPIGSAWNGAAPLLRPGGRLVYFAGGAFGRAPELGTTASGVVVVPSPLETGGPLVIITRSEVESGP